MYKMHSLTCIHLFPRFSAFADLFSVATRQGLQGLQTQNPGIYYHNAALYAIEGRDQANRLCLEAAKIITIAQAVSKLAPGKESVYYGQRPWRHGFSGKDQCMYTCTCTVN